MCPQERKLNRLTAPFVKSVTVSKQKRFSDGRRANGLALSVRPSTVEGMAKSWVQAIRIGGRETLIGIGGYPECSLAEARRRAAENMTAAKSKPPKPLPYGNTAPRAGRRAPATALCFGDALDVATVHLQSTKWKGARTAADWENSMSTYVLPKIGAMAVEQIGQDDVIDILRQDVEVNGTKRPLYVALPGRARTVLQRVTAVLKHSELAIKGYRHPVSEAVAATYCPTTDSEERPAVPMGKVISTVERIRADAFTSAALALELQILTACRPSEVRLARRSEFAEENVWVIPANRMKRRKTHRVALSSAAMDVLARIREHNAIVGTVTQRLVCGANGYLFHGKRADTLLPDGAVRDIMQSLDVKDIHGKRCVPHGWRSSFRDFCSDRSLNRLHSELCLSHDERSKTEKSYDRGDYLKQRMPIMEIWGEFVTG